MPETEIEHKQTNILFFRSAILTKCSASDMCQADIKDVELFMDELCRTERELMDLKLNNPILRAKND